MLPRQEMYSIHEIMAEKTPNCMRTTLQNPLFLKFETQCNLIKLLYFHNGKGGDVIE